MNDEAIGEGQGGIRWTEIMGTTNDKNEVLHGLISHIRVGDVSQGSE
jgi:hypothetical protein